MTLTHYPWWRPRNGDERGSPIGFGAFARILREGGDHVRLAVGPQLNHPTFELRYSYRGANHLTRATHAPHAKDLAAWAIRPGPPRLGSHETATASALGNGSQSIQKRALELVRPHYL